MIDATVLKPTIGITLKHFKYVDKNLYYNIIIGFYNILCKTVKHLFKTRKYKIKNYVKFDKNLKKPNLIDSTITVLKQLITISSKSL